MINKKKLITLTPLSDLQIESAQFDESQLWMVRLDDRTFGPFETKSLKEYANKNQELLEPSELYNMGSEIWCQFFSNSLFQRRKPQLIAAQNLIKTNSYFVQINKQTHGPLTEHQINALLDSGRLQPYSLLSVDQRQSWIKIFEFHLFDRRNTHSDVDLPFIPKDEILENLETPGSENHITDEVLFELANINSHNNQKISPNRIQKLEEKIYDKNADSANFFKHVAASLAVILTITVGYLKISDRNPQNKLTAGPASSSSRSINNSERTTRKPASTVKRTRSFRPRKVHQAKAHETMASRSRRNKNKVERIIHEHDEDFLDDGVETIDINDPEVQAELTRQLAGDYELDGGPDEFGENEFLESSEDEYEEDPLEFE